MLTGQRFQITYKNLVFMNYKINNKMNYEVFLDDIYSASEIYFADIIKEEREKAIKEFLIEQLKRRQS